MNKELGRITHISFGHGGYQDACFGLSIQFGSESWGVGTFIGGWSWSLMKRSDHCKWTEAERDASILEASRKLDEMLKQTDKTSVEQLVGTPVEVTFDNGVLAGWRVLTEVLP